MDAVGGWYGVRIFRSMRHILAVVLLLIAGPLAAQERPDAVIVGGPSLYVVKAGDTVTGIAARFGMAASTLLELNAMDRQSHLIAGQQLRIDNPHIAAVDRRVDITINVAQRMLFLRQGEQVTGYPISVGRRSWPTPLGEFAIDVKEKDPAWDVPISIQREMAAQGKPVITRVAPSPENPLGAHWLGLSIPGLGIHGTNAPSSIYRYASHGCIRLHPEDVAELFARVSVGTTGVLTYQPVVMAIVDGRVWLEVHGDEYRRAPDARRYVDAVAAEFGITHLIDWAKVARAIGARAGRAEDVTARD